MASEIGRGQTESSNILGVRTPFSINKDNRNVWESIPKKVIVLYVKSEFSEVYPEYRRTRGIRWESGGTILQA